VITLTVTHAMLALLGLTVSDLQTLILTRSAAEGLGGLLIYEGFDLARPIDVYELEDGQGFNLTQ
jgi:hypothetical protein